MAFRTNDFLKETSTSTGTGNITLGGARTPGSTFASAISNGDTFHYAISHDTLNEWETGLGTMLTSTTFSRSVISSSNANALVNFSGGSKRVDVVLPASRIVSLAGPLFFNGVSASSGNLSFDNAGGVSFGVVGNVVTAAAPGFTGLTTNNAFQLISLATFPNAIAQSITNATDVTLSATRFVLGRAQTALAFTSNISGMNVGFYMSGSSIAAGAWFNAAASNFGANVQNISFAFSNAVTFGGSTATQGGVDGAIAVITAIVPRIRQIQLAAMVSNNSITALTDTVISNTSAATAFFQASSAQFGASRFSTANVAWAMSGQSIVGLAWMNMRAGTFVANDHNLSVSDANGVTFGLDTITTATFGRIAVLTASVNPQIGLVSHIGGQSVANVTRLAFSDASNVTWSLSTAASAATVFASVAAGGGGGITAFPITNSVSSVAATRLELSNANGFAWLLSTGAGVATLSASYTVPSVAGLISAFALTNAASSVAATRLELSNANGFSFLLSTGASVGTLSGSFSSLSFSNLNGVSFGIAGSTLTASARPDIGVVSHIGGNVASNVTQLAFSNASNVTFSLSTAASAATLIASVAAAGGFTFSGIDPLPGEVVVDNQFGQNSLAFHPVTFPNVQFDRIVMPLRISNGASGTTIGTISCTFLIGIYTREGNTGTRLSLLHNTTHTLTFQVNSTANSSLYTGLRYSTLPWTTTFTQGQYWYGFVSSTNSAGVAVVLRNGMLSQSVPDFAGFMGSSNATLQMRLGNGFYTATTGALPASVAFNQVQMAATSTASSMAMRAPCLFFHSGTA